MGLAMGEARSGHRKVGAGRGTANPCPPQEPPSILARSIPAARAALGSTGDHRTRVPPPCHPEDATTLHGITHRLATTRCPPPWSPTPRGRHRPGHLHAISPRPLIPRRREAGAAFATPPPCPPPSSRAWSQGGGQRLDAPPLRFGGLRRLLTPCPAQTGPPGWGTPSPGSTPMPAPSTHPTGTIVFQERD